MAKQFITIKFVCSLTEGSALKQRKLKKICFELFSLTKVLCYSGFDHRVAEVQQILPDRIGLFLTEVQMISNEMSVVMITPAFIISSCSLFSTTD